MTSLKISIIQFNWTQADPTTIAAFLALLVEFVEALTILLPIGTTRGWRDALAGYGMALLILVGIIAGIGSTLNRVPLGIVQVVVGALLLLFSMHRLRKAILRTAGVIPMNDEAVV